MAEDGNEKAKWIKTGEAAKRLDCCRQTVRSWCDQGAVTFRKTPTNQYQILESEIDRLIVEMTKTTNIATSDNPIVSNCFSNTN